MGKFRVSETVHPNIWVNKIVFSCGGCRLNRYYAKL